MVVFSIYRVLRFDLHLTPYKIAIMQHLKDTDIESRMEFCRWMLLQDDNIVNNMWFSDEAHFHLDGAVNKQNMRFWGTAKPEFHAEKPLHSEKVTAWAALNCDGIIGPFFFEDSDGETCSVNSDRYLSLMKMKFLPALKRRGTDMKSVWFNKMGLHLTHLIK